MARLLTALLVALGSLVVTSAPAAAATVASPTLTSPPSGAKGYPLWDSYYDLAPFGYEEEEFFVSGTALALDATTAPYVTRIVVSRPSSASRFNGTVLLDWVNVTAQFENAVDTMLTREMLLREGFAYVHVSAQEAGICCTPLTPKVWDPVRYNTLSHPGDAYAFDMFTQVAQAFRAPAGVDPMGAVGASNVQHVLAAGQSQSANELQSYLEEWLPAHPEAVGVIDGILLHGNVPGDKGFGADAAVPVVHLLSDFEAQDDGVDPNSVGPNYRLWEIGGSSHSDFFIGYQSVFGHGPRVLGGAPKIGKPGFDDIIDAAGNYGEVIHPLLATCTLAGATLPMHYAASAALHQLNTWVSSGNAPPNGPRFQFSNGQLAADEHGNTVGGIRMPPIDVPVAHYESTTCQLGGITIPFTDQEIQDLHGTHAQYYALMKARTDQAVADGWLLPDDAIDLMRRACRASVRFGEGTVTCAAYVPPAFNEPLPAVEESAAADLARTGGEEIILLPAVLVGVSLATRRFAYGRSRARRRNASTVRSTSASVVVQLDTDRRM